MGREIVYCEDCGNSLRETDFERGRARTIDNRPFCIECRPLKPGAAAPAGRKSSSGRVPLAQAPSRKNSTGAIPIVPGASRRPGAGPVGKQSNPLPIIAGVGGVAFLIALFAITQGGSRRAPTPPEPAPPPLVEIPVSRPAPPPPPTPAPPPRETPPPPPPPRRENPTSKPSDPLVAPTASEKLDAFVAQIRQMIQGDTAFERVDEILNMFAAAAKNAGLRASEVEKMKSEYLGTLDEPLRRAVAWRDWKITSTAEGNPLLASHNGRSGVYVTHPMDRQTGAHLDREVDIPTGKKTTLSFWVSCHEKGDFELRIYADNKQLLKEMVGPAGSGWKQKSVDLTPFAGRRVALRLENFPNNWEWEHAYWSDVAILSE